MIKISSEEMNALASEFTYSGSKAGMIGGYCEDGFPLYYANEEMVQMLGYDSLEELIQGIDGKVANTIHPDDMEQVSKDLGETYYEGLTYETTYRMPKKDGTWFWTVDRGKVVRAEDGRLAIISICTDMTRFVHRQNELEAKSAAADYMFKNIPGGYHACAMDEGYPFLNVSERFLSLLGWTREELRTKFHDQFANLVHPDDRNIAPEYVERIVNNTLDRPYQNAMYRLQCKDGYRWFSDTTVIATVGGESFFQGVITDIDTFISEKQQRYEIISSLSSAYEEISQVDFLKERYQMISGPSEGETGDFAALKQVIRGKRIGQEDKARILELLDYPTIQTRLRDTNTISRDLRADNGSWYTVSAIVQNRDHQGNVMQILLAAQNITAQKQKELKYQSSLEEARDRADAANRAKTQFLFNMSHDIRTPMNALLGYNQLLKNQLTDPKLLHYQKEMERSGSLLLSIINNVLDMARIESGKMELDENYAAVGEVADEIMAVFASTAKEKGIRLIGEKNVSHPHVLCDVTKVKQIVVNLLSNAVKYTPEGGTVTLRTQELPCDEEGFAIIRTEVVDSGIGMSSEFLPRLYDAFSRERNTTTGKVAGTGLGMPIVKELVDMMGGNIEVESELGQGTKFTVTLRHRIADERYYNREPGENEIVPEAAFKDKRILMAEDNDLNAEIAMTILEGIGLKIDRAHDGIQCVSAMEQKPAGTYDLILMDVQMPNMDGYKATEAIRRLADPKKANIPIVAMTANAFEEDRKEAISKGMNAHLAKPLDIQKVIKTIAGCVNSTENGVN